MEKLGWPKEYLEFVRLFNERDYFEAHEALEDLWVVEVAPLRDYYKGLIQAAVALCHWERGNLSGARKLWVSARRYLSPYPERYEGLELGLLRESLDTLFAPLTTGRGGTEAPCRSRHPVLILQEEG